MVPAFSSFDVTRRQALVAGGLGTIGLSLPQLLRAESQARTGTDKSIILVVPWGGPSQHDTFDPKPNAPAEVRSVYQSIATRTIGLRMGEHLPRLAAMSERFAILRAVSHHVGVHHGATHYAFTGHLPRGANAELTRATRVDFPTMGSVLAKMRPAPPELPSFVQLPLPLIDQGIYSNGQYAGFLGTAFDPLVVTRDPNRGFGVLGSSPPANDGQIAMDSRRVLLQQLDAQATRMSTAQAVQEMSVCYNRAFHVLRSAASQNAFDLSQEPTALRDRYGRGTGQSLLAARRLVEAGVRLVFVNDAGSNMKWDTHDVNYGGGIDRNLRESDQALSALIEDLFQRGMLDTTIVIWMAEFGRTPTRKPDGGRDHWPRCYSGLLAGGGIQGGRVFGTSDSLGAYPRDDRVRPEDIHATIYHLLGVPLTTELHDSLGRPFPLCTGSPITSLL